jgi:hypothetical protein
MRLVPLPITQLARRACPVALVMCAALLAFRVAPASAQCGQTTNVSPRRSLGFGPPPLAVGDSVLYDAADALSYYGFETNAMVCRTMAQGITWLEDDHQTLPPLVVVALGTNGSVTMGQIDQLLTLVGPNRLLAMVTPHHGDYGYVPGLIRLAAQQHPGSILLLDWDRLSADHPDWFAPDGIHLGGTAGIDAFAHLVASSLLLAPTRLPAPTRVPVPAHAPAPTRAPAPTVKPPPRPPHPVDRPKPTTSDATNPVQPAAVARADGLAWSVVSALEAVSLSLVGA